MRDARFLLYVTRSAPHHIWGRCVAPLQLPPPRRPPPPATVAAARRPDAAAQRRPPQQRCGGGRLLQGSRQLPVGVGGRRQAGDVAGGGRARLLPGGGCGCRRAGAGVGAAAGRLTHPLAHGRSCWWAGVASGGRVRLLADLPARWLAAASAGVRSAHVRLGTAAGRWGRPLAAGHGCWHAGEPTGGRPQLPAGERPCCRSAAAAAARGWPLEGWGAHWRVGAAAGQLGPSLAVVPGCRSAGAPAAAQRRLLLGWGARWRPGAAAGRRGPSPVAARGG